MSDKLNIIEIGSRGGSHRSYNHFPISMNFYLFEADKEECLRLKKKLNDKLFNSYNIFDYAVLNGNTNFFYIYENENGNSFKKHNLNICYRFRKSKLKKTIKLKTISLDNFFMYKNDSFFFSVIDAEGAAYEIIESGKNIFGKTLGTRIELEFSQVYQDAKLFHDNLILLNNLGFKLLRIETCNAGALSYTTDMNEFSISPTDALPLNGDFILINDKLIRKNILKHKFRDYALVSFIWMIHNGVGYYIKEYLDIISRKYDTKEFLSKSKYFNDFVNTFSIYLSINRSVINKDVNYKKNKSTKNLLKLKLNDTNQIKKLNEIYNSKKLYDKFINPSGHIFDAIDPF